jgi:hypothetical protein
MRVALHTRLKPGKEDEYECVHVVDVADYSGTGTGLRQVWELP